MVKRRGNTDYIRIMMNLYINLLKLKLYETQGFNYVVIFTDSNVYYQ